MLWFSLQDWLGLVGAEMLLSKTKCFMVTQWTLDATTSISQKAFLASHFYLKDSDHLKYRKVLMFFFFFFLFFNWNPNPEEGLLCCGQLPHNSSVQAGDFYLSESLMYLHVVCVSVRRRHAHSSKNRNLICDIQWWYCGKTPQRNYFMCFVFLLTIPCHVNFSRLYGSDAENRKYLKTTNHDRCTTQEQKY